MLHKKGVELMAQNKNNWVKALSEAANLGSTVVAAVVIGYLGGNWLDKRFDTEPWLALVGFLLGVATGINAMWKKFNGKSRSNPGKKSRQD